MTLGIALNDIVDSLDDDIARIRDHEARRALRCDADFHYYRRPPNNGALARCICDETPWPKDLIPQFLPTLGVWASRREAPFRFELCAWTANDTDPPVRCACGLRLHAGVGWKRVPATEAPENEGTR